ncbi:hypothetical protein BGZ80_008592 [Entomortierella chlamydospora]|uniref:Uncharacterized protein n=1 Tax=Entomortierella chlamydospora TaxID=101097 RepID=A0A9P6T137_9FUNG|nr:hypothetical protein BGZ79_004869 [Entomortierella chlamydospora]KAG0017134.1 hypothetical protein BGZ80_008592 [Entomortierella chlamydospora]
MSEFARAEAAVPQLKIHQQTFKFMDLQPVYIQITEMDSSDWIWISAGASPLLQQNALGGAGANGGGGGGAFGDFAMSMPPFRPGQAAVSSTLLGNPLDETPASIARRLATKFKRQFFVNVDIQPGFDNAMLIAFAERKVLDMLQSIAASKEVSTETVVV